MPDTRLKRSALFVSAVNNEAIAIALSSDADIVCLDMEDGVPVAKKEIGRQTVLETMERASDRDLGRLAVRMNCPRTVEGLNDLLLLSTMAQVPQIVVPKVRYASDLTLVWEIMQERGRTPALHCVIETCEALENVLAIARSCKGLSSLMFGGFDLSAALGVEMAWEPLQYARGRVIHAAAAVGLDIFDAPHLAIDGIDALRTTTERCRDFGFTGRITKHAEQVETINSVFTPSVASLDEAASIIAQFEESPYSQLIVNGKVIEQPAIRAMKRALIAAGRIPTSNI